MLLSEAFPRNPNPVMRIKESLDIDSVEDLQEKLKDPNFEYRALKIRGVGQIFLQKVKNYDQTDNKPVVKHQQIKLFGDSCMPILENEVNEWIHLNNPAILNINYSYHNEYYTVLIQYKP
jgi:hypothetical protein